MNANSLWRTIEWIEAGYSLQLTRALVHFLWQGCAIAILYAVADRGLRRSPAAARYFAGVVALLLMAACLPATLCLLPAQPAAAVVAVPPIMAPAGSEQVVLAPTVNVDRTPDNIESQPLATTANSSRWTLVAGRFAPLLVKASPYASAIYLSGVALMLLRVLLGLWGGRRLRQACTCPTDDTILDMIRDHAHRMGLRLIPAVAYCRRISVPVVVGVLRPMILLPASLASGLTFTQLAAVLLHELAHVRRYDLMINVLQRLVEAMLFFHPAMWWVSRRVSAERENACDDLVLRCDCSRLRYADALVCMAELCTGIGNRAMINRAALAATGGNASQFKRRVLRLLGADEKPRLRLTTAGVLVPIVLAAFLVLAPFAWSIACSAPEESLEKAGQVPAPTDGTATSEASPELAAQKAALETLEEMGVMIYGAPPTKFMKAPCHSAQLWKVPPQGWEYVARLAPLEDLAIIASDVRGSAMEHVIRLKTLKKLDITNSQCTLVDLKRLAGVAELEGLKAKFSGETLAESNDSLSEKLGDLTSEEQQRVEQLLETSKQWKVKPQDALRMAQIEILTDRLLQSLSQLKHLRSLTLGNGRITCWGLEQLKDLQAMEEIDVIVAGPAEHLGLVLKGFPALRRFRYATVSDGFFAEIAGLAHLENLEVWANDLTDAGVPSLVKLTSLQTLAIRGNALTDNGLKALSKLPRLESLDIRYSDNITTAGVENFQRSCPGCKVDFRSNAKPAVEAKPRDGGRIVARVGSETIREGDLVLRKFNVEKKGYEVLGAADEVVEADKGRVPPEQLESKRDMLKKQILKGIIEEKLVCQDAKRTIPSEAWTHLEPQLNKQFEDNELPKMMKIAGVSTAHEFDQKLRAMGTSLEQEKRSFQERTLAQQWISQQTRPKEEAAVKPIEEAPADIKKKIIQERSEEMFRQVREYMAKLEARTPVWTIFDDDAPKPQIATPQP